MMAVIHYTVDALGALLPPDSPLNTVKVGDLVMLAWHLMRSTSGNPETVSYDGTSAASDEDERNEESLDNSDSNTSETDEFENGDHTDYPSDFEVCKVIGIKRKDNQITDLSLGLLKHQFETKEPSNFWQISGRHVESHTDTELPRKYLSQFKLNDEVERTIVYPLTGDLLLERCFNGSCPASCDDGWLDTQEDAQVIMKEDMETLEAHHPVCPVCIGKDFTRQYHQLRSLRDSGVVDVSMVVDFYTALNPVRRALGYRFKQFDEREWGYRFEDMLSEDEYQEDDGEWDYYDDALDVNADIVAKPACKKAVDALPRSTFATVKKTQMGDEEAKATTEGEGTTCQVCQEAFSGEDVVATLPCSHFFCDECIKMWLKQSHNCPVCRYRLPLNVETASKTPLQTRRATTEGEYTNDESDYDGDGDPDEDYDLDQDTFGDVKREVDDDDVDEARDGDNEVDEDGDVLMSSD